jgi:hypothetical protein
MQKLWLQGIIVVLLGIFSSCSRYSYIPISDQTNKQQETFYPEQDLSTSKGASSIEPYKIVNESWANVQQTSKHKNEIQQFQKSVISTKQTYLMKTLVKNVDSSENRKQPIKTKNTDSHESYSIASIIIGLLGILLSTAIPSLAAILGLIASLNGVFGLLSLIFDWFANKSRHSTKIWLFFFLGMLLGCIAIFLAFLTLKAAFSNFNMGSGNYI